MSMRDILNPKDDWPFPTEKVCAAVRYGGDGTGEVVWFRSMDHAKHTADQEPDAYSGNVMEYAFPTNFDFARAGIVFEDDYRGVEG